MSFIAKLFGGGTKGIGQLAKDIREAVKGKELDPKVQIETAAKLVELQTKINEAEAGHRTLFVAGWRPFIGWVCGTCFIIQLHTTGFAYICESQLEWITSITNARIVFNLVWYARFSRSKIIRKEK